MADTRPRYRQIADALAQAIEDGAIRVGSKLPARKQIAANEGVSVGTVETAVDLLVEWGLVRTKQGLGVFVESQTRQEVQTADQQLAELRAEVDGLKADVAAIKRHLGIG